MKKKLLFLITTLTIFSLVGCSKDDESTIFNSSETNTEYVSEEKTETTEESSSTEETSSSTEKTAEDYKKENEVVLNKLLDNFNKPINEIEIFDDVEDFYDSKITVKESDTKYWLYPQMINSCFTNEEQLMYFVNPTNKWMSSDELTLSYLLLSQDYAFPIFTGYSCKDTDKIEWSHIDTYFGEPSKKIEKDFTTYFYDIKDDFYLIITDKERYMQFYLIEKENCSLLIGDMTVELGYTNLLEESKIVSEGTVNHSIELPFENDTISINVANKTLTFNNLEGYEVLAREYILDENGSYIVHSFSFDKTSSSSDRINFTFSAIDSVGYLYACDLNNSETTTLMKETDNYNIYKVTLRYEDPVWCVNLKDSNLTATLLYCNDETDEENIVKCTTVGDYLLNHMTVTE